MPGPLRRPQQAAAATHEPDREAANPTFFQRVHAIVARIPSGRVTTYGTIARALGEPRNARKVGWAMSAVPEGADLPCHRVVNRDGDLTGGWQWGHPDIMAGLLHDEGVPFVAPHRVDLSACLWLPDEDG